MAGGDTSASSIRHSSGQSTHVCTASVRGAKTAVWPAARRLAIRKAIIRTSQNSNSPSLRGNTRVDLGLPRRLTHVRLPFSLYVRSSRLAQVQVRTPRAECICQLNSDACVAWQCYPTGG
jgi:hypothetical protein